VQCVNPTWLEKQNMNVPCGRCRACRERRSTEWTIRLSLELAEYENKGLFVTLTYDDFNLPKGGEGLGSLCKRDLQLFLKILRRNIPEGKKIKYYACGEYGEKPRCLYDGTWTQGFRPHYHLCILGLDYLCDEDVNTIFDSWSHCEWTEIRKKKSIGYVSVDSIKYTTDYIKVKPVGKYMRFDDIKFYLNREFPFSLMSKGIGFGFISKNNELKNQILTDMKVPHRGVMLSAPRYFVSKLDVPIEVKSKKSLEARHRMCEKYGYSKLEELLSDPFGRIKSPRYADALKQAERNIEVKAQINSRQSWA